MDSTCAQSLCKLFSQGCYFHVQGAENNYETDLILPLVLQAAELAGLDYRSCTDKEKAALKVIADHARAVTYLISDGVTPSNIGRGYVLRRLLRRAVMKVRFCCPSFSLQQAFHCVSCSLCGQEPSDLKLDLFSGTH